jgi:hypothetical protein
MSMQSYLSTCPSRAHSHNNLLQPASSSNNSLLGKVEEGKKKGKCVCAEREETSGGRSGLSRPRTAPPLCTEVGASTADPPSHTTALHFGDPAPEPHPSHDPTHGRVPPERSRSLRPVRHGRGQDLLPVFTSPHESPFGVRLQCIF